MLPFGFSVDGKSMGLPLRRNEMRTRPGVGIAKIVDDGNTDIHNRNLLTCMSWDPKMASWGCAPYVMLKVFCMTSVEVSLTHQMDLEQGLPGSSKHDGQAMASRVPLSSWRLYIINHI